MLVLCAPIFGLVKCPRTNHFSVFCWTSHEMKWDTLARRFNCYDWKQHQSKSKKAHNMNLLQQHRKQYVWDNFNEIVAGATVAAVLVPRWCDENKINIQSICEYSSLNPPRQTVTIWFRQNGVSFAALPSFHYYRRHHLVCNAHLWFHLP